MDLYFTTAVSILKGVICSSFSAQGAGPDTAGPALAFVIVNWNGGAFLRRAVASILQFPPRVAFEIVIVDNASVDGSLAWLRSDELKRQLGGIRLRVIENASNLGFGLANNQAFAFTHAPFLFLLNADSELREGTCDALIDSLGSDDRIGVCGPRIVNPDGSLQISVWRNPPSAWSILLTGFKLHRLLPRRLRGELLLAEHWRHDRRRDVGMLAGAALLVRREVIETVGGFDNRFHMYGEDNEWCLRTKRAGWRLLFEPAALVMHHGGQSSGQRWTELERMRVQLEAFFLFQRCCLNRRQRVANLLALSIVFASQLMWRRLLRRPTQRVSLALQLHLADLRRTLRSPSPRKPHELPAE